MKFTRNLNVQIVWPDSYELSAWDKAISSYSVRRLLLSDYFNVCTLDSIVSKLKIHRDFEQDELLPIYKDLSLLHCVDRDSVGAEIVDSLPEKLSQYLGAQITVLPPSRVRRMRNWFAKWQGAAIATAVVIAIAVGAWYGIPALKKEHDDRVQALSSPSIYTPYDRSTSIYPDQEEQPKQPIAVAQSRSALPQNDCNADVLCLTAETVNPRETVSKAAAAISATSTKDGARYVVRLSVTSAD